MAAGLGVLRLAPAHFWSMTPREIAAAMQGALGVVDRMLPTSRESLARLMSHYPDIGAGSRHQEKSHGS